MLSTNGVICSDLIVIPAVLPSTGRPSTWTAGMDQAANFLYLPESSLRYAGTCYSSNRLSSKIQPLAKRQARTLLRTCATVAAPPQQAEGKKAMVAAPPQARSAAVPWPEQVINYPVMYLHIVEFGG